MEVARIPINRPIKGLDTFCINSIILFPDARPNEIEINFMPNKNI